MIPAHKTHIMVHTLATRPEWAVNKPAEKMVQEVRRWHVQERGWNDIAYAAIIAPNGSWAFGRDLDRDGDFWEETAAAAKGWNKRAIHIALAGGFGASANDKFSDHFTEAQDAALRMLIKRINKEAGRELKLIGHNEVAAKGCPGFQVRPWYAKEPPRTIAGSKTLQGAGAAAAGTIGSTITAVGQLEGEAQIITIVLAAFVIAALAFVFRARIKDWMNGRR